MTATWTQLLAKIANPTYAFGHLKSTVAPVNAAAGSSLMSSWMDGIVPVSGGNPTTAAITDNTTVGSIGQSNKSSGATEQRVCLDRYDLSISLNSGQPANGMIMLVDRLAHMGGLDGTNITAQTVGLGSLTRYTSGVGVWAAAEIYTAVGVTATTLTVSYSNTVPTSGITSPPISFGAAGNDNARRVLPISLATGDVGVTAVASATLASTTLTAGNWGITLYKTLACYPICSAIPISVPGRPLPNFGGIPVVPDGSCLQLLSVNFTNGSTTLIGALMHFFED